MKAVGWPTLYVFQRVGLLAAVPSQGSFLHCLQSMLSFVVIAASHSRRPACLYTVRRIQIVTPLFSAIYDVCCANIFVQLTCFHEPTANRNWRRGYPLQKANPRRKLRRERVPRW